MEIFSQYSWVKDTHESWKYENMWSPLRGFSRQILKVSWLFLNQATYPAAIADYPTFIHTFPHSSILGFPPSNRVPPGPTGSPRPTSRARCVPPPPGGWTLRRCPTQDVGQKRAEEWENLWENSDLIDLNSGIIRSYQIKKWETSDNHGKIRVNHGYNVWFKVI
jgi:hypothetical protein